MYNDGYVTFNNLNNDISGVVLIFCRRSSHDETTHKLLYFAVNFNVCLYGIIFTFKYISFPV